MNSNFKPNLLKELNSVQWWLLKFNQIGSFVQPQLSMLCWLHWELFTSIEYAFVFHGLSYWNCLCKMISDMKLKTYFSVIKELVTYCHSLIYMECIIACCLNCFERRSICILNLSLLGCVELNAVCHVQSTFLLRGDACDCKYCFEHCSTCCSEQAPVGLLDSP